MFEVVYLTGAPAAGKSTTARLLAQCIHPLEVFEFGERLTAYLAKKPGRGVSQTDVRRESSGLLTPDDIRTVDRQLLEFVARWRMRKHILIDSHPVTKERYGFRVTPYSLDEFAVLAPTQIWVLFADPETTVARIAKDDQGRPTITHAEAAMHTQLQASVATGYGMRIGTPLHLFDTSHLRPDEVASMLAARISPPNS